MLFEQSYQTAARSVFLGIPKNNRLRCIFEKICRGQYVTLTKKFLVCGSSIWVLNGWIIHFEVGHHQVAEGGVHRELPDTTTNLTVIHNHVNKPSTKDKI